MVPALNRQPLVCSQGVQSGGEGMQAVSGDITKQAEGRNNCPSQYNRWAMKGPNCCWYYPEGDEHSKNTPATNVDTNNLFLAIPLCTHFRRSFRHGTSWPGSPRCLLYSVFSNSHATVGW